MGQLDELREFVSEMRFRVDSSDYFALIDRLCRWNLR